MMSVRPEDLGKAGPGKSAEDELARQRGASHRPGETYTLSDAITWAGTQAEDLRAIEAFRRLQSMLSHPAEGQIQVVVVTSPLPGDGKSTVARNLALTIAADGGTSTLLVDADLRHNDRICPISPAPKLGLTDVLVDRARLESAIVPVQGRSLSYLGPGKIDARSGELLTPSRAEPLIAALRSKYRWVIIDTPPVMLFSDAATLVAHSDGALLVARFDTTPAALYRETIAQLGRAHILGTILNDAKPNLVDQDGGSDYYYRGYKKSRD